MVAFHRRDRASSAATRYTDPPGDVNVNAVRVSLGQYDFGATWPGDVLRRPVLIARTDLAQLRRISPRRTVRQKRAVGSLRIFRKAIMAFSINKN